MQRISKQSGIAAANDGAEERLHLPKTIRQLRRQRSIIMVEPPITFLPRRGLLIPELFAKVFTNQNSSL